MVIKPTMHSLRATAASELFHAGVPEKVIQQRTGHLSLGGLRQYEKVTTTQQQAVCRVLSVNTNSTYDNEVSRMSLPSTSSAVPSSHSTSASQVVPSTTTTAAALPQMNFSSCLVHIYQGTTPRIELMTAI